MNKIDKIVDTACYVGNISLKDFKSRSRERHIVDIKRMTYSIVRETLNIPFTKIAKHFKVNHATIIHHCKLNRELLETDSYYYKKYTTIYELVKSDLNLVDVKELTNLIQRLNTNKLIKSKLNKQLTKFYNNEEIITKRESTETS
tara:strand:+ start:728 stop:1162 length:435 start_codon:yes stop_codon:yes gene_type:complete